MFLPGDGPIKNVFAWLFSASNQFIPLCVNPARAARTNCTVGKQRESELAKVEEAWEIFRGVHASSYPTVFGFWRTRKRTALAINDGLAANIFFLALAETSLLDITTGFLRGKA